MEETGDRANSCEAKVEAVRPRIKYGETLEKKINRRGCRCALSHIGRQYPTKAEYDPIWVI